MTDGAPDPLLRDAMQRFVEQVGSDTASEALELLNVGFTDVGSLRGREIGDFRLEERIGRGGMGDVYCAQQISVPGRKVAVKILPLGVLAHRARFAREVEVIGRLDHPNIVPILSADLDHAIPHYAMKLIPGVSLHEALQERRFHGERGSVDFGALARIVHGLADALHHAHERGVVHRDVNPRNVLISEDGSALLVDFGLAHDERSSITLTQTDDTLGTPESMAPEQISTEDGPIGPVTDVYALGVTLYRCLTGRSPFTGTSRHEVHRAILEGDAPRPRRDRPDVPRDLQTICMKAMARRPEQRYPSAHALAEDLEAFLEYRPILATAEGPLRRSLLFLRRHRFATRLLGVAVICLSIPLLWSEVLKPRRVAAALWEEYDEAAVTRERREDSVARLRRPLDAALAPATDRNARLQRELERRRRLDQELLERLHDILLLKPDDRRAREEAYRIATDNLRELLELPRPPELFESAEIARWQSEAERHAEWIGDPAGLLDPHGQLEVHVAPGLGPLQLALCPVEEVGDGTLRFVPVDHPRALSLGTPPAEHRRVPEGSYLLRAWATEGPARCELPLLISRAGVQSERERQVRLDARALSLEPGFRCIPGGLSLLGGGDPSDPLRRVWVETFFLAEDEFSLEDAEALLGVDADWIRHMARVPVAAASATLAGPEGPIEVGVPSTEVRSSLLDQVADELVREKAGDCAQLDRDPRDLLRALVRGLGEPDWSANDRSLLLNLNFNDLGTIVDALNHLEERRGADSPHYYRLPTPEEWERAGRGADGRAYPWGHELRWEFFQNYRQSSDVDRRFQPIAWPAQDRSPFGVHDMAGSLREPVMPWNGAEKVGLKRMQLRGASRFSHEASEVSLLSLGFQDLDVREYTTGLRLARDLLEELPTRAPAGFHEDFEACPDGPPPSPWGCCAFKSWLLGAPPRARVESGRVRVVGYAGNFSPTMVFGREFSAPDGCFEARVELALLDHEAVARTLFTLVASARPEWASHITRPGLQITEQGGLVLSRGKARSKSHRIDWDLHRPTTLHWTVHPDHTTARLHPTDAPHHTVEAQLQTPTPSPHLALHYFGIEIGNLGRYELGVEEVELRVPGDGKR